MKIAFCMIAFQADYTLEPCLESIVNYGPIYAAEGPVKYWQDQGFTTSTDHTNELLDKYHVQTVHGQWNEKDDEVRAAWSLIPQDTDFIWCVDADEVWEWEAIESILTLLETNTVDAMAFKPFSFYGGFDYYMTGFEESFQWQRISRYGEFVTHRPPTFKGPNGIWRSHRLMDNEETDKRGWRFAHYSYVFPEQIKAKTIYYHSWSNTIPNYFERVYLKWVLGDEHQRYLIEHKYQGVHDWNPSRRGPCYTQRFAGAHPDAIQKRLPELRARFDQELEAYR